MFMLMMTTSDLCIDGFDDGLGFVHQNWRLHLGINMALHWLALLGGNICVLLA